jgi:nicotinamidase-related amidase
MPFPGALHNRFAADRLASDNAVLLVIDGQVGMARYLSDAVSGRVRNNLQGLAKIAGLYGVPSLFTLATADGADGGVLPELLDLRPDAEHVQRVTSEVLADIETAARLRDLGRHHLLIAGLTSAPLLAETALAALRQRYEVHVVLDASTEDGGDVGAVSIARMAAAGINLTTWVAVLADLATDAGRLAAGLDIHAAVGRYLANYSFPDVYALGLGEAV